jgi:aspartyl protease family protein
MMPQRHVLARHVCGIDARQASLFRPMNEFPRTLKHITVWLVLGTGVFLAVQAWQAQQRASVLTVSGNSIELRRGADGHFHWPGTVNGQAVSFLVDTGATRTALPQALAERVGLAPEGRVQSHTAGGTVQGWQARADLVLDGGVRAERLPVTVLPELGAPLLGMDVLSRLRFSQTDGVLRLSRP